MAGSVLASARRVGDGRQAMRRSAPLVRFASPARSCLFCVARAATRPTRAARCARRVRLQPISRTSGAALASIVVKASSATSGAVCGSRRAATLDRTSLRALTSLPRTTARPVPTGPRATAAMRRPSLVALGRMQLSLGCRHVRAVLAVRASRSLGQPLARTASPAATAPRGHLPGCHARQAASLR